MYEVEATVRGNVGGEVERVQFQNGSSIVRFTVANTKRYLNREGEWVDGATTWYRVNCRRALADNVADCVRKGQAVIVQGHIVHDNWEQDGVKRQTLMLDAMSVGHDLNRGTSSFVKVVRDRPESRTGPAERDADVESRGPAPELAEDPWSTAPAEGDREQAPEEVLTPA